MPKIRNMFTYSQYASKLEQNNGERLTRPDMAYTPQQLLQRHRNGQTFPKLNTISYHQDIQVPDPRTLDLVEMEELLQQSRAHTKQAETTYKEALAARKKAAEDKNAKMLSELLERSVNASKASGGSPAA